MRIVYLHQYFNTPEMNGGSRSYEMAKRWVADGHEVIIITSNRAPDADSSRWSRKTVDGIIVYWGAFPYDNSFGFPARIRSFLSFAIIAGPKARDCRGDVIFATSTPLTIIIPAIIATLFRRTPVVFEVRDLWPEMPIAIGKLRNRRLIALARALEKFAYNRSRRIVALSPGMAHSIAATGTPTSKITVAPNACDISRFNVDPAEGLTYRRNHAWLADQPYVIYCGTLGELNNVSFLAAVAAQAAHLNSEVMFGVYGSGGDAERVHSEARRLEVLNKNFFMMGPIAKHNVPAVMSAATVITSLFLPIPEMTKNSANKFFDGLAAGRPVAINYGGWQAELVNAHGLGLVLDPHDPARAAKQLCQLIDDPERLRQARDASAQLAKQSFSREMISRRVLTTIQNAFDSPQTGKRKCQR